MFCQTTYMEQDSTNNHLALAKTNLFLNTCFLRKNYAILSINIKARVNQ